MNKSRPRTLLFTDEITDVYDDNVRRDDYERVSRTVRVFSGADDQFDS